MKEKLRDSLFAICELLIGALLLVNPIGFTMGILIAVGVALVLWGIVSVIGYFRSEPQVGGISKKLSRGILALLAGLFCVLNPGWFIATFPVLTVIYGIGILISGVMKVEITADMIRAGYRRWGWCAAGTVLTLACAVLILCNPFGSTVVLWKFIAISLIVEAALDLVAALFQRKNEAV